MAAQSSTRGAVCSGGPTPLGFSGVEFWSAGAGGPQGLQWGSRFAIRLLSTLRRKGRPQGRTWGPQAAALHTHTADSARDYRFRLPISDCLPLATNHMPQLLVPLATNHMPLLLVPLATNHSPLFFHRLRRRYL